MLYRWILPVILCCAGCSNTSMEQTRNQTQSSHPGVQAEPMLYTVPHLKMYTKPSLPPEPIMPNLLEIPSIQLKATVEAVGLLPNGQMGVPKAFDKAGILAPWTKPGEKGNAVIAGHFDHYTGPAIFYQLRKLKPGDKIVVSKGANKRVTFMVRKVESFKTEEAPLEQIFGKSDKPHLNLITCSGRFNKKTQEHARRLVVFADLAKSS